MSRLSGIGLRGEADFLRRQNNQILSRQKRIKTLKVKGLHVFIVLVVFVVTGFAAFKAGKFFLTWEKLNIKSFKLINGPMYESEKLRGILKTHNGNIMSLNLNHLRKDLLKLNEIKDVSISRRLPSTLEIRFELRKPVFQIYNQGSYKVIDNDGVVLFQSKQKHKELITIKEVNLEKLDLLIPFFSEISQLRGSLDYVTYREPYGVILKLRNIPEFYYPGEMRYVQKINYFLKLRANPVLKANKIINVDLRFNNRIYLEYEEEVNKKHEK